MKQFYGLDNQRFKNLCKSHSFTWTNETVLWFGRQTFKNLCNRTVSYAQMKQLFRFSQTPRKRNATGPPGVLPRPPGPAGAPSNSLTEVRLCAFVFPACCFIREYTMNLAGAPSNSLTEGRLRACVFPACCFIREFTLNPAGAPPTPTPKFGCVRLFFRLAVSYANLR